MSSTHKAQRRGKLPESHQERTRARSDAQQGSALTAADREVGTGTFEAAAAGNLAVQKWLRLNGVQAKLAISQPSDPDEQEADRVADAVAGGGSPITLHRKCASCASGTPCGNCEQESIQRKSTESGGGHHADGARSAVAAVQSGGQPLPRDVRAEFEGRFDRDFSAVRVHTHAAANEAARSINARAYTHGKDIAFAPGEFAPTSFEGRRLLAHELTHVGQQAADGQIRRAPDFKPTPGNPGPNYYFFRGVRMSADPIAMRTELHNVVRFHGIQGLDLWHDALMGRGFDVDLPFSAHARAFGGLRARTPLDVQREMENDAWKNQLAPIAVPLADGLYPGVRQEAVDLLAQFERAMGATLEMVLGESEKRINAERVRYGLKEKGGFLSKDFQAQNTPDFQALVGAAQDLLALRSRLDALEAQKARIVMGSAYTSPPKDKLDQIDAKIAPLEETYKHAKAAASLRHPALGAVLDESSLMQSETQRLKLLAGGRRDSSVVMDPLMGTLNPTGASAILGQVFAARQDAIDTVRSRAKDPDKLWTIQPIIDLTRSFMAGEPTGMLQGVVEEKIKQRQFDQALWSSFLLVVGLALALPTGGSSLAAAGVAVAGLSLSVYQAVEGIRKYQFEMALANTDLDKRAYALAAEEPSAFWVALDVAFVFLDAHQAVGAFRALKNEARLALTATEGAEAIAAESKLLETADKLEGAAKSRLAERLRESLARLRKQGRTERALGGAGKSEAEAFAHAAHAVEQEAKTAETIAVVAGHELKVTRSGHIVLCTECTWLRSAYFTELGERPELLARLESAEQKVVAGTLDAAAKSDLKMLTIELEQARKLRLTPGATTSLPKELEEASALAPKAASKDATLVSGESAKFLETTPRRRGVVGDRLTGDHIPSRAALVEAKQNALWEAEAARLERPLTPAEKDALLLTDAEKRQINEEGLTLVKGEAFHRDVSRTYLYRNRAEQIALDAADLSRAVHSDFLTDLKALEGAGELTRAKVAEYIQHYQNLVSHGIISYSEGTNNLLLEYLRRAKP